MRYRAASLAALTSLCLLALGAEALGSEPSVLRTSVSEVTSTSATLKAEIDPGGKVTEYHFEYDTSKYEEAEGPHGISTPPDIIPLPANEAKEISAPIKGLTPGTTYYFRVVVLNGEGEVRGPNRVLTTPLPPSPFGACPNDEFRVGNLAPLDHPSAVLPDCRAYEQASPVDKNGLDTVGTYPTVKASVLGNAVSFAAASGVPGGEGAQEPPLYLARRGAGSWFTQGLLPPATQGQRTNIEGWTPDFAHVFTQALLFGEPQTTTFLDRSTADGPLTEIVPHTPGWQPSFAGTSADGSKVFFQASGIQLAPGAALGKGNLYVWDRTSGKFTLVGALPDAECKPPPCAPPGGSFAGPYDWVNGRNSTGGGGGAYYVREENAISTNGQRVYFTAGGTKQLYLRNDTLGPNPATDHVSASEKENGKGPKGTDAAGTQPAAFMAATPDGSKAFFTSPEKLTDDATTGPEPTKPAAIARANLADGKGADLEFLPAHAKGIAISGSHVYWADPTTNSIGRAKLGATKGEEVEPQFIAVPAVEVEVKPGAIEKVPARPQYVAIDPSAEQVYWTNAPDEKPGHGSIGRAELGPSGPEEINSEYIAGKEEGGEEKPLLTNPQGIAVNSEFIYWANAGQEDATRTIGRAKPGVAKGEEVNGKFISVGEGAQKFTPQGIAINVSHIYMTIDGTQEFSYVFRFDLNGEVSSRKILFDSQHKGVPGLRGIALDSTSVYWAREGQDSIGRAPLDLSSIEREWIKEAGNPRGLALDASHVHWSAHQDVVPNPGNDLYRYDASTGKLTDLVADDADKNGIEVRGVLGVSDDGAYIYFVANGVPGGVANSPNAEGESAQPGGTCKEVLGTGGGTCNLYLWHDDVISFIARVEDEADWTGTPTLSPSLTNLQKPARVSVDGLTLVFRSKRRLTSYDNEGSAQLYRYRVGEGAVSCVSCVPTGEPPLGVPIAGIGFTAGAPPSNPAATLSRSLSGDGKRIFFESTDALVEADTNGEGGCPPIGSQFQKYPTCQDVYEWEAKGSGSCKSEAQNGGCLYLISTGKGKAPSFFADASADGDDVFIITRSSLVRQDGDQLLDVYDASVGGGLASQNPVSEVCASTEDCRPPEPPPSPATPPVSEAAGAGNVKERAPKPCRKPKRLVKKKGKARCVAKKQQKKSHGKGRQSAKASGGAGR